MLPVTNSSKTSRVEGKQITDLITDPKGSVIKSVFCHMPGIQCIAIRQEELLSGHNTSKIEDT